MRKVETTVYDYDDMIALEEMTPKEVIKILMRVYRGYVNRHVFPDARIYEYSAEEYYTYEMQCAFNLAYEYLGRVKEDD